MGRVIYKNITLFVVQVGVSSQESLSRTDDKTNNDNDNDKTKKLPDRCYTGLVKEVIDHLKGQLLGHILYCSPEPQVHKQIKKQYTPAIPLFEDSKNQQTQITQKNWAIGNMLRSKGLKILMSI